MLVAWSNLTLQHCLYKNLGQLYRNGDGAMHDDEQARLYYELAAKKGQIDAQGKFLQKRKGCRARLQ